MKQQCTAGHYRFCCEITRGINAGAFQRKTERILSKTDKIWERFKLLLDNALYCKLLL